MGTRRDFLTSAVAAAALGGPARLLAQGDGPEVLTARPASVRLLPESYPLTQVWSYGGTVPGQVLRAPQGARLYRQLVNALPDATSVHWHGVRLDNAMDGVAGLTQQAVAPGASFEYDFHLPDAGTYWYHAHNRSFEQVARGLYGALIVDEPDRPDIDRDEVLMLDDWRLSPDDGQLVGSFDDRHDHSHAGRLGNYVATNGQPRFSRDVAQGERLRLRLINAANARIFALGLSGMEGWIMAHDGMPLAEPEPMPEVLFLGPAQRVDLFVDVTAPVGETAWLVRLDDGQGYAQAGFPVIAAARDRRPAPAPLPPNPRMAVGGLDGALRLRLDMQGGAMGRMTGALLDGRPASFQELAAANRFWAFNGVVGLTDTPLAEVPQGRTVRIAMVNDTVFPHAMHLHGMHFREVLAGGGLGPMRDTLLIAADETREIAFMADNPGDWLLHCHMLSHAAAGMSTWLRVA